MVILVLHEFHCFLLPHKNFLPFILTDTVRKGIIDINMFAGNERSAMVGAMSALLGTSIWLIVATFFKLPVSGTHSVIGATIGYALVASGPDGVNWGKFGLIGKTGRPFTREIGFKYHNPLFTSTHPN